MGEAPDTVDPAAIAGLLASVRSSRQLSLLGRHTVPFIEKEHMMFYRREALAEHPNGMKFHAYDAEGESLRESRYLSVGGGFVVTAGASNSQVIAAHDQLPFPFRTGRELLTMCKESGLTVAQLMMKNELTWRDEAEVNGGLDRIWQVMQDCVARGCGINYPEADGELPGPLRVRRRAPELYRNLTQRAERTLSDPLSVMDWVNLYAMAVNEENAAGGRVVTAPTNGAAGIIPAVLHYYDRFIPGSNREGVRAFLLTAAAVGLLVQRLAVRRRSRLPGRGRRGLFHGGGRFGRGAGRHGRAGRERGRDRHGAQPGPDLRSRRRAGADSLYRTQRHGLGQAVNAARMALRGDGQHYVSLDSVIKTMRETGADMKTKYKETARGGWRSTSSSAEAWRAARERVPSRSMMWPPRRACPSRPCRACSTTSRTPARRRAPRSWPRSSC